MNAPAGGPRAASDPSPRVSRREGVSCTCVRQQPVTPARAVPAPRMASGAGVRVDMLWLRAGPLRRRGPATTTRPSPPRRRRVTQGAGGAAPAGASVVLLTLAAGQFLMTLDTSVMNVAIATVAEDVGTDVTGIQTAITLYTLVMATLVAGIQQSPRSRRTCASRRPSSCRAASPSSRTTTRRRRSRMPASTTRQPRRSSTRTPRPGSTRSAPRWRSSRSWPPRRCSSPAHPDAAAGIAGSRLAGRSPGTPRMAASPRCQLGYAS